MDRRNDPRAIVTPYAFSVHPDLLGRPLATPLQRLGAIGIDLVVIFGLSRIGGTTLAIASGVLLFWLATRKPGKDVLGKFFRFSVGCLGLFVLGVTVSWMVVLKIAEDPEVMDRVLNGVAELADSAGIQVDLTGTGLPDTVDLAAFARLVPGVLEFRQADDSATAHALAVEMASLARAGGMPLREIRSSLAAVMPGDAPWASEAGDIVDAVMTDLRQGRSAESGPGAAGQEAEASPISDSLALDSIARLNRLVGDLDEELEDLEGQLSRTVKDLEAAENEGLLGWLLGLIDDLGLGFGWAALYLTVTHAWWKGLSVGKKIFGIRVVMIDKRPLNWWLSFERAGGYAAGFATGLLGFAQVFWDPNRQGIHDKVSETIVIQDGKAPIPGPWIAEGRAQWERGRGTPETPGGA